MIALFRGMLLTGSNEKISPQNRVVAQSSNLLLNIDFLSDFEFKEFLLIQMHFFNGSIMKCKHKSWDASFEFTNEKWSMQEIALIENLFFHFWRQKKRFNISFFRDSSEHILKSNLGWKGKQRETFVLCFRKRIPNS